MHFYSDFWVPRWFLYFPVVNYTYHLFFQNHFRKLWVHVEQITVISSLMTMATCLFGKKLAEPMPH